MPFYFHHLLTPERDLDAIARNESTIARLEMERDRLRQEFTNDDLQFGSVSGSAAERLQKIESFADRLIRENVEKQAKPETSGRWQRIAESELARAAFSRPPGLGLARARKQYLTNSFRDVSKNHDTVPRTVYGAEAWIGRLIGHKFKHAMHLNGGFITRAIAVPCVQRDARRQVMFARRKAGKGYRGRRNPSKWGQIEC